MNKTISVVTPVYNNAQSLPKLFDELMLVERELESLGVSTELIFVDDGSTDASFARLLEFKEKRSGTKVVKLTRNFGAVHCSKAGFKYVTGDAFLVVAADLQDPPGLIKEMVLRWLDGAKFVICARANRDDPVVSKIYSKIYYKLLRLIVVKDYPEGGYDMSLMDRVFLSYLVNSSKNVFTPLLAYWLGYTPEIIKYDRPAREHGRSSWTFSKKLKAFLDVMLGFSITPIRAISGVGAFVAILSFLYGCRIIFHALFNKEPVAGFATVVALITMLLGLVIVMLGIIGEYLWRIFDEVNKRPESVVEQEWL